jgi:hypothetical protein
VNGGVREVWCGGGSAEGKKERSGEEEGCKAGTHFELLIVEVSNIVRQMGLETASSISSRGVSSGAKTQTLSVGQ